MPFHDFLFCFPQKCWDVPPGLVRQRMEYYTLNEWSWRKHLFCFPRISMFPETKQTTIIKFSRSHHLSVNNFQDVDQTGNTGIPFRFISLLCVFSCPVSKLTAHKVDQMIKSVIIKVEWSTHINNLPSKLLECNDTGIKNNCF